MDIQKKYIGCHGNIKLKYMIAFRKIVNIQKISERSSYIPLILILLPTF